MTRVWLRLAFQPWWIQWLVYAAYTTVTFAFFMVVTDIPGDPDRAARWSQPVWWCGSLVVGVAVAGLIVAVQSSHRSTLQNLLTGVAPDQYGQVSKAVTSGPIPDDPAMRAAAARFAQYRLDQSQRFPRWLLPLALGLVVVSQAVGFLGDPQSITLTRLLIVLLCPGLAVHSWLNPRLLETRAQLLGRP